MRYTVLVLTLCCISIAAFAQPKTTAKPQKDIFVSVEQMPSFNGDIDNYINRNLRYPQAALAKHLEGSVYVTFVVNEDGSVSDAEVKKRLGSGCDEEALRIVNAMPKWKPGKQNGRAVNCYASVAVKFKIVVEAAPGGSGDPNGIDPGVINPAQAGPAPAAPKVFSYVDQMPEFSGNIYTYISTNIKYPDAARENNVEGRVLVKFVVNEDGTISDVAALRGIGSGCDEEAVRVVKGMPKWKPGKQNGQAVKVNYTLPVTFRLETPAPVKK